ncbi:Pre-rRNA-processing protein ipi3 [Candidozyma auris]|uniref:Pre-rRNA-processing protein IPI3 n=2 Tax=Candidozyma auris TaxID=498019 RepID=A0AB36W7N4_CANAR|nr:hypothetical_protein [[Candida] auris]KND98434.1 pre-rrna-processing protein ipi3 [[Candida] auris]PIS51991.1 hypothetical protein B9J08_003602 [[Candida] auris]PIS53977.1 hypothetical protein CJI97_003675 [[Candida] auris]QEO21291.1 hypothetical_protein [[Candida] auris]QWW21691.1 hypothetical protein CA7LBN_000437 [[Candida] auris]
MDEVAFYVTQGDPEDKHSKESLGVAASVHKSHTYASFRNADCPLNGAAITGMGPGERLFVAGKDKALITCYSWGKEGADQKFPIPETVSCLSIAEHPVIPDNGGEAKIAFHKPKQHIPWLLAAGTATGKLYIWELASGNLLCVKDAHYQGITCIRFTKNSDFVITGGSDSRVTVWRTVDLVSFDDEPAKPFATFSDHSLAITDIAVADSPLPIDVKIYTASKDSTVRLYNIVHKKLLTTFVFPSPVECIARDSADRAFYAGLTDGTIRQVPLYVVNKVSNALESVVGTGKVVTVAEDPEVRETFVYHQSSGTDRHATRLSVSFDGMSLISGDTHGHVIVGDVVTKQIIKSFTPCKSAIAFLHVETHSDALLKTQQSFDKKSRLLQPLKRVIFSGEAMDHVVHMEITSPIEEEQTREEWYDELAEVEQEFKREYEQRMKAKDDTKDKETIKELQEKLEKVSGAYNNLKGMYEELYKETQEQK